MPLTPMFEACAGLLDSRIQHVAMILLLADMTHAAKCITASTADLSNNVKSKKANTGKQGYLPS